MSEQKSVSDLTPKRKERTIMSELRLFYHEDNKIKISKSLDILPKIELKNIIWIDLNDVALDVESRLEQFLKIYIQEDEEIEEIEIDSRYIETDDGIVANTNFAMDNSPSSRYRLF